MPLKADIELFQQGYKLVLDYEQRLVYRNDRDIELIFNRYDKYAYMRNLKSINDQVSTSEYTMGLMVAIDHKIQELGWVK